ncbi:MAG: amino acid ABC transporter ATP-binding protein [Spirochaetaceae bacterium]|jgi:ABC-type polar amino acid transport system ATPase subunit|nr:amino acid ABC transporter ATP-binding protein [Spirochaetaceae bacterium]
MLNIAHLSKRFHQNLVLNDISLTVQKGEILGIIGPSGTGKSTLLRCINLLEKPESGHIEIGAFSMELTGGNRRDILELRRRSEMVFQQFNLFRRKTALQNVMEGLIIVQKMSKSKAEIIAREQLDAVGLSDRLYHYPQHLSGGQQQRVAIARALAMRPEILLFDEPTSALDPELTGEVLDTIKKTADMGFTMLLVSHEMNFVRSIATRIIFIDGGKIVEDGPPDEVFNHPKSERAREFIAKMNRLSGPEYVI